MMGKVAPPSHRRVLPRRPRSFVVAERVELPWPQGDGDMLWGMVSLHDIFPVELLAKCVPKPDEWPVGDLAATECPPDDRERVLPSEETGGGGLQRVCRGLGFGLHPQAPGAWGGALLDQGGTHRRPSLLWLRRGGAGGMEVMDVDADPPPLRHRDPQSEGCTSRRPVWVCTRPS